MLSARKVKCIAKIVEKRLKKEYRGGAYFYIDNLSLGLEDMAGLADIHCVCGFEKYKKRRSNRRISSWILHSIMLEGFVKSNRECAAVLTLHCIEALDDTCYFHEGRK